MEKLKMFNQNFKYTILFVGVSAGISYFIFGKAVALSIALGGATILWGMSQLAKSNRKKITTTGVPQTGFSVGYLVRYIVYGIVLFVSYQLDTLDIFGTLFGLLTFKIMLYTQAFVEIFKGGKSA